MQGFAFSACHQSGDRRAARALRRAVSAAGAFPFPTRSCFRTCSGSGSCSSSVPRLRPRSVRPWCTNVARLGPSV